MLTLPNELKLFDVNQRPPQCARWKDSMPKQRDGSAYRTYIDARTLWRSKVAYQLTRDETTQILRDVRLAAAQGDWGARALMARFYRYGLGPLENNNVLKPDPDEAVKIIKSAVTAGQAWAYYDLGVAYENGYGGVPRNAEVAWSYFLRAAELGSPDAQMALASAYQDANRSDYHQLLITCAFQQGHGPAAYQLGISAEGSKNFTAALNYYQEGTKFGHDESAAALMLFFEPSEWGSRTKSDKDELRRLGLKPDHERHKRYNEILSVLMHNPDLKLTLLDEILPLPPAELPPWPGLAAGTDPVPYEKPSY